MVVSGPRFVAGLALVAGGRLVTPRGAAPVPLAEHLGHRMLNPSGALYYRLSGILGGAARIVFFVTRGSLGRVGRREIRILFLIAQVFGVLASCFFVLTGMSSEDMMPMHSWFSRGSCIAFGTAVGLTGVAAARGAGFPKWFTALCVATSIAALGLGRRVGPRSASER